MTLGTAAAAGAAKEPDLNLSPPGTPMIENESPVPSSANAEQSESLPAYTHFPRAERWLEEQLAKVPASLPAGWDENIVRAAPWLALAFAPVQAFSLLALFGVTALSALLGSFDLVGLVLGCATFVCDVLAIPGLFKRTQKGWAFMLYANVLVALDGLLMFNLFTVALSTLVVWLTVQVKPHYRDE